MARFALGLDFGTNSARALIVDCDTGEELGVGVSHYASGVDGVVTDPTDANLARQDPADYHISLRLSVQQALERARGKAKFTPDQIVGVGVDATGSTPLAVWPEDLDGAERRPGVNALAWLWKDHTSYEEAEEITDLARAQGRPYLAKCGGVYSSEWFWAKLLRAIRLEPSLFDRSEATWMELCDFIPSVLCSVPPFQARRSLCAAGHKAMYSAEWGGLPSKDFLAKLDPRLGEFRDRLYQEAHPSDQAAGTLSETLSNAWQVGPVPVAVGLLDAHAGAVGSGVAPGSMVKILGTSTCDIMVSAEAPPDVAGLCGVVAGSVIPGLTGIEAGQAAVGDIFAWWSRVCGRSQEDLTAEASTLRAGESGLVCLDWNNGNRSILSNPLLTGLMMGQTLRTTSAEIYRALIEATAFGALKIIRLIEAYGIGVREVIACGGIAEKNRLAMQIYADVLNRPIRISRSGQAPALGAAICGSVAGGAHSSVQEAQSTMTTAGDEVYEPHAASVGTYGRLYEIYSRLHDVFGLNERPGIMKELRQIRGEVIRL